MTKVARDGAQRVRPTVGLLTTEIFYPLYYRLLWSGVADAVQELDANLLCFPGGMLRDPEGFRAQSNVIYDLVNAENVDGLVITSGNLSIPVGPEEMRDFCERYRPLPMVSIGLALGDIPSVMVDDSKGMRDVMVHLIEAHGYRRIAFIQGPEDHQEVRRRFRTYAEVLAEHGLSLDADLVVPGKFDRASGLEAVHLLLDERGAEFEAIVTLDDNTALGAMEALQARGMRVPGDVAVVGFDDALDEVRFATPPLTTVRYPYYDLGRRAVEMVLAWLEGAQVPERVGVPTRLVVRQSCGCLDAAVMRAMAGPVVRTGVRPGADLAAQRQEIVSGMVQAARTPLVGVDQDWAEQLLDAFSVELEGRATGVFLRKLGEVLCQVVAAGGDVAVWQEVLSVLRCQALPCLGGEMLSQAEDLWQRARLVIGEMARRVQAYQGWQAEQRARTLREIGEVLTTTLDVAELMDMLARHLPQLGVPSCFLSLYENPKSPADRSRLILAYDEQGRVQLEEGGRSFPSRQLVPDGMLPHDRRYSMVVEALYFREDQLGFALLEAGPQEGIVCEALRGQISSALKGALLLEEALEARSAAEKANQLKTRLLANVSHELRTPLNTIIGYTDLALDSPNPYDMELPSTLLRDLQHIHGSAEHLLRVINDLLDLSRAEIDELDLYQEIIELRPFLEEAFHSIADSASQDEVTWHLQLPERLPVIQADPFRLRQVLLNLLSNARKFTEKGQIVLGAEVTPPHLHIWVQDTGIGIPPDQQERIFEPFVAVERAPRRLEGIGLGLSITRRLVALHRGSMSLESQLGQGSVFHVYLPLPSLSDQPASLPMSARPVLLLISNHDQPAAEIVELSRRRGSEILQLKAGDDVDGMLAGIQPTLVAWDLSHVSTGDWMVIQRLCRHPYLSQVPFLLYGQEQGDKSVLPVGLTNLVTKPVSGKTLLEAINALRPPRAVGPILIVDDDPQTRELYRGVVEKGLPGYPLRTADDGLAALASMAEETPSLVILDLMMPEMDGFEVLDRMRADERTHQVPVLILSGRQLTFDDVKRLERHARVTFQSKGILSEDEAVASLHRVLFGSDTLPPHTGALVKRAVAYLHQNYDRPISRREVAEAIGVSANYLSEVFRRELGLSPWEYLNRYRIRQAKELLRRTDDTITAVALRVGFNDPSYFGRVFRKLTGLSPSAYRDRPDDK